MNAALRSRNLVAIVAAAMLASALSAYNIARYAPATGFPAWPFDPASMSLDQIIIAYGLLPRAAVALLCGACLGLSGALLQRLLRNPIAEPATLGISSGAQLAIVAATLFAPGLVDGGRQGVAFGGAALAALIVVGLSWRRGLDPIAMIIGGLLVGITASAISAALVLAQGEYLMSLVSWNGGALSQQDWSTSRNLLLQFFAGALAAAVLTKPLTILGLDDSSARRLGLSVNLIRFAVIAIAVWLAASVAAAVGLVSFIGLAAPAFARLAGVRKASSVLLLAPVYGALLLLLADGIVQLLSSSTGETFPTGAVTALLGGPLLLFLLPRLKLRELPRQTPTIDRVKIRRPWRVVAILFAVVPLLVFLMLTTGRAPSGWVFSVGDVFHELLPWRWPRLAAAGAAGALLAVAGTIMQRITGNAMASPEVMGVSGGAGVGFAAVLYLVEAPGPLEFLIGSIAGSLTVLAIVVGYVLRKSLPPDRLLLAGIAISSFATAILSLLIATGNPRSWQILIWISGTALSVTAEQSVVLMVLAGLVLAGGLSCLRWLEILPLGEAVPSALGMSARRTRIMLFCLAAVATAAASMLVGPLSFVGLMAPHMARMAGFRRAPSHLVAACLIGTILMLVADWAARTVTFPYEQPLGIFASLIGAPYLLWLIGREKP